MRKEKENDFGGGVPISSGRLSSQGLSSNAWNTAINPAGIYNQPGVRESSSKFSSWNNTSISNDTRPILTGEVDELLMFENEGTSKSTNIMNSKKDLLSMSGSMDLENNSYDDIEDEMLKEGLEKVNVSIKLNPKSRQDAAGDDLNAVMADSLDFENSDDLNKIISKYEKMLGGSSSK